MILGEVDDEVIVKGGWEGSKKVFKTIYLPISSKMIKLMKIKKNLINKNQFNSLVNHILNQFDFHLWIWW